MLSGAAMRIHPHVSKDGNLELSHSSILTRSFCDFVSFPFSAFEPVGTITPKRSAEELLRLCRIRPTFAQKSALPPNGSGILETSDCAFFLDGRPHMIILNTCQNSSICYHSSYS
jgi:hypothetical protein